eukprot:11563570-Alexandrium_andersonii.AAC.1
MAEPARTAQREPARWLTRHDPTPQGGTASNRRKTGTPSVAAADAGGAARSAAPSAHNAETLS